MYLRDIPFEEIEEKHLKELIDDKFGERQQLEYKLEMYTDKEQDRIELYKDITAMVNSTGGLLIIGIDADKDGIPTEIVGIENGESAWDSINRGCMDCIEERIIGMKQKVVHLSNGKQVLIIWIPRGLKAPYMIRYKSYRSFYVRHDRNNVPMGINEVRGAILRTESYMKKAEQFLDDISNKYKLKATPSPIVVFSGVPVFLESEILDIHDSKIIALLNNIPCETKLKERKLCPTNPYPFKFGLECDFHPPDRPYRRFELHRNGYCEFLLTGYDIFREDKIKDEKKILCLWTYYPLTEFLILYFCFLKSLYSYLGQVQPILFKIAVYWCSGIYFPQYENHLLVNLLRYTGDKFIPKSDEHLELPVLYFDSIDNPEKLAKQVMDRLHNVFHLPESPFFDSNGKYLPNMGFM